MKLNIQKLDNRFSKVSEMINVDLEDMMENPIVDIEKSDLPMFNAWCNESHIRKSENVKELYAIILDYDSGYTIHNFCDRYYSYQFYLYTTSSHTLEHPKFRVVIPLMSAIKLEDYTTATRKALEMKFPECDPTAFYTDHYFYPPAVGTKSNIYRYQINYGRIMNPKIFTAMELGLNMTNDLTKKIRTNTEWTPNIDRLEKEAEVKISDIINQPDGTGRYDKLLKLCYKYSRYGLAHSFLSQQLRGYKNAPQILKTLR